MSRPWTTAAILLVVATFVAAPSRAEGEIALFLGQRQLDDQEWQFPRPEPDAPPPLQTFALDSQPQIGMLLSVGPEAWKVRMAIDLFVSQDDDGQFEARLYELDGGVRKFWGVWKDRIRPYAGGGAAFIKAEVRRNLSLISTDTDDLGAGLWLEGGAMFKVRKKFSLGLDLRYSTADVTLFGDKLDAGGAHGGLLFGWKL